jgi:hypothetical protein
LLLSRLLCRGKTKLVHDLQTLGGRKLTYIPYY